MGKDKKIYAARMQGLAYALDIVKKGGIEALEKEIKARGAYYVPMEISYEQVMELKNLIADRILSTFAPAVMFTLHDTFGFGKDRLLRWKNAFMKRCDMMSTFDPFGVPYEKVMDYATILTEKYGLEFEWDKMEDIEKANKQERKQLCDIDYVIQFLEERGQAEAAELLREYGEKKEEPYNKMAFKEHQAAQRREEIYRQIPEIKILDAPIAKIAVEMGKKLINGESVLEQFKKELMGLKEKRAILLRENGYPEDYFDKR